MRNQIDWKNPEIELPKCSGDYVALTNISTGGKTYVSTISYSARHKAFNCRDWNEPRNRMKVLAWAEQIEVPDLLMEDGGREDGGSDEGSL